MKNWKVLLGVGGACAVCCAVPLAGMFAALAGGASGALALYPGAVWPAAGVAAAATAAVFAAVAWQRRRKVSQQDGGACDCPGTPQTVDSSCGKGSC